MKSSKSLNPDAAEAASGSQQRQLNVKHEDRVDLIGGPERLPLPDGRGSSPTYLMTTYNCACHHSRQARLS